MPLGRASAATGGSRRDAGELDRFLRARGDALAACLARRSARRVGRLTAVGRALQLAEEAELRKVGVVHPAHFEDVVGTHLDAFGLPFAARSVDAGSEG